MSNNYEWKKDEFVMDIDGEEVRVAKDSIPASVSDFFWRYGVRVWAQRYFAKVANGTKAQYLACAKEAAKRLMTGDVGKESTVLDMKEIYDYAIRLMGQPQKQADQLWKDYEAMTPDQKKEAENATFVKATLDLMKKEAKTKAAAIAALGTPKMEVK